MKQRLRVVGITLAAGSTCALAQSEHPGDGHIHGGGTPGAYSPNGWVADGVLVLGHVPLTEFPGATSGADCWGYVSPSGREYALMGVSTGIGVVEITDPLNPQIIGHIAQGPSLWQDVTVLGDFAYSVTEAGGGIRVIDLRQVDSGVVTLLNTVGTGPTHTIISNPDTGWIYRCGGGTTDGTTGFRWYNAGANPTAPIFVGEIQSWYVHEAQVVNWMRPGPHQGREIAFLFSGAGGNGSTDPTLRILDVTNKASPTLLSECRYPGRGFCHQGWTSEDQSLLYLDDEFDEFTFGVTSRTHVIDISDLTNPFETDWFTNGSAAIDHNQYTHNGYLYQSNYRSGLRVWDVSANPTDPTEVAFLDTFPADDNPEFDGAWGNYPYFPSGTVIVSDLQQGLIICKIQPNRLEYSGDEFPDFVEPAGGSALRVTIEEVRLTLDPASVQMHFFAGTDEIIVPGSPTANPGEFEFLTPPIDCGEAATFYFAASATTGETFYDPPLGNLLAEERHVAAVASGSETAFADSFETHQGWAVSNSTSPPLTDGAWARGVPANGGRGDPPTDGDGSGQCYLTDNVAGNSDVDNGLTTLTSPAMDATGDNVYLNYWRWYSNSSGAAPFADVLTVEVSNNNGASWMNLETVGPDGPEVSGGWFFKTFRINDVFPTPSNQFKVRFIASDLDEGSVVEAAVDGIELVRLTCENPPLCPADLSGSSDPNDPAYGVPDAIVDSADFFYYLDQFASGNTAVADLSGSSDPNDPAYGVPDGALDASDFFYYLDIFVAGCP